MRSKHLVLYDDSCALCRKAVLKLIQKDPSGIFGYTPLWGDTAKRVLKEQYQHFFDLRTIVLIEDYLTDHIKVYSHSRAIFRIYWLLGGYWRIVGCFSFLFPFTNLFYQLVARHRHVVKAGEEQEELKKYRDRFLN